MMITAMVEQIQGLQLNGSWPVRFDVVDLTPENHATKLFGIRADYGWAERILFSDAYERDAVAICTLLNRHIAGRE